MRNRIATIAFALGLIAVGMAAFQDHFGSAPYKEVESKRTLKEVAADAAKTWLAEKVQHKNPPTRPVPDTKPTPMPPYQMVFTALGLIAMGLGLFAWTQHTQERLAASAMGLGLIAIAWKWMLIAVGVAIVIFIVSLLG